MKKLILICLLIFSVKIPVFAIDLSAGAACIIAADTGEVIYSENANQKMPMASTTKIMTGLLALENAAPDEEVTVSQYAASQEGSSIYLRAGEKISMNDLVYGLMLNSGNDAAVAIAEHISGSVSEFAKLMTEKAKLLGAENTQFKNPNGLNEEGHYTTAHDLALIAAYAMKNEKFYEIVSTKSAAGSLKSGQTLYFSNHNKLLNMYDGAVGVKTGFTKAAGRCLVSAAERDGILLVAVTLNAPDDWNDHMKMLNLGFEKTKLKKIVSEGQILKSITDGEKEYGFCAGEDMEIASVKNADFEVRLHLPETLPAPMNKNEKAGYAEIFWNGKYITEIDIVAACDIPEKITTEKHNFTDSLQRTVSALFANMQ